MNWALNYRNPTMTGSKCLVCGGDCSPYICDRVVRDLFCHDNTVPALGDRDSIVAFLRREYRSGPWEGTPVFLILADAIERKVDREN